MARDNEPGMGKAKRHEANGSGKTSAYVRRDAGTSVSWGNCDPSVVTDCIDAITERGDALLIGRSVDGAVLVLTVCAGDERIKYYARTAEEMNLHMDFIKEQLDIRAGRA